MMGRHQGEPAIMLAISVAQANMDEAIQRKGTSAVLGRSVIASGVVELQGIASALHRRYEEACNTQLTEAQEKATARMETNAFTLCEKLGIKLEINRDPRGWPLICRIGKFESEIRLG